MRFADIFLPSDGAFDDKISETFHHNAVGERGRRGWHLRRNRGRRHTGHSFHGIPAYSGAWSRQPVPDTSDSYLPVSPFPSQTFDFFADSRYKQSATYRSCNGILNGLQRPCTPLTKIPQNGYFPNLTSFFQNQISRYGVFLPNH